MDEEELEELEALIPGLLERIDRRALRARLATVASLSEAFEAQVRAQFMPPVDEDALSDDEYDRRIDIDIVFSGAAGGYLPDEVLELFGDPEWVMSITGPGDFWTTDILRTWEMVPLPDGGGVFVSTDADSYVDLSDRYAVAGSFTPPTSRDEAVARLFVDLTSDWLTDDSAEVVSVALTGSALDRALDEVVGGEVADYWQTFRWSTARLERTSLDSVKSEVSERTGLSLVTVARVIDAVCESEEPSDDLPEQALQILRAAYWAIRGGD